MDEKREELIAYRLEQAHDALEQAQLLFGHGHSGGAVNRAYYAMFYAVQALIAKHGVTVSKHGGAIAFFDREIVKPKRVERNFSKWLHWLFDLRQDADYGTGHSPTRDQAAEGIEAAKRFVAEIERRVDEL